ncbi:MAG TPA: hypothetical protein VKT19_03935, partial [Steroidobacteraceae bacterium]|nr:hypothetical protein [Steroidobacteraceae bacterium]
MRKSLLLSLALALGAAALPSLADDQTPSPDPWCRTTPAPAFCQAVRGVRASGWPAQTRSEVMATHGMVVT